MRARQAPALGATVAEAMRALKRGGDDEEEGKRGRPGGHGSQGGHGGRGGKPGKGFRGGRDSQHWRKRR